jgi:uncharacterized membrane protein YeiH
VDWISEHFARLMRPDKFIELLVQLGTFAGAISGVRLASAKKFDWFGAYVVGFVTAMGGGTLRDMLMLQPPFWYDSPSYLVTTFVAVVAVALFGRRFISEQITWFVFDTIAISIFMVIGMEKVIAAEGAAVAAAHGGGWTLTSAACWWKATVMGVITAVFGGVLRDICVNDVPLIFRKEFYALACASGGIVYFALAAGGVDLRVCAIVCMVSIFVLRAFAIKYHLGVPVLSGKGAKIHHHHAHGRRHAAGEDAKG